MEDIGADKTRVGAVVYLPHIKPLQLTQLGADFQKRWPGITIKSLGGKGPLVNLHVGHTDFTIEIRKCRVPEGVTREALEINRAWHDAEIQLNAHQSHLTVGATVDRGASTVWAEDLTRILCSLLSTSEAIGICWLNGPVLAPTSDFVGIAEENLGKGIPPLMLWLAAVWLPAGRMLYTKGMWQCDSPEIFISHQKDLSTEMGMYLFEVAHYVLTSGKDLRDGETIDGPNATLQISTLEGGKSGRPGRLLTPVKPN